jgi:hypothetical protein
MFLQFQVYAFHVEEACGQAPEDYLHEDERQRAPTFQMEDHLEQRLGHIHLKGRFCCSREIRVLQGATDLVDNISNPIKRMISMIFGAHDELL